MVSNITSVQIDVKTLTKLQGLLQETPSIEPKFGNIKKTADSLQQDPCLCQEERANVQESAERLSNRYSLVLEKCNEQKARLVNLVGS